VKTSEGDLFSIKCPGPGSDYGRYWRKSAITIARNTSNTKLRSENMTKITSIKRRGKLTKW
jgi:N-methylhydantoinase B/oxoprolinase/acetone carboxylase alpha subunit